MDNIETQTVKKVMWHVIPYLFIIYFVAFLDRSSITYASIGGMDENLGLTATTYGFISGFFFVGYFLFGIPGNMILEKIGARKWMGFILIFWGAVTVITGFVNSIPVLITLRFLLGVAEAGLFPGMTLYITYWIQTKDRALAIAAFMIAPPLANCIGAPVSTWIITQVHNVIGLDGWRWLFIIVGLPAVLLGLFTFMYLSDKPKNAKWLSNEEKNWLIDQLQSDYKKIEENKVVSAPFKEAFANKKIWKMTSINFFYCIGLYGITFWLPKMVQSLSNSFTTMQIGLISAIPYLLGTIALIINGRHSDKTGERIYHTAFGAILGGLGFIGSALTFNIPVLSITMICLAAIGIYAYSGPYWAITTAVDPRIAAVGLGIVNAVGNFGGFFGPYAIGWLNDATESITIAMYFLAAVLILTGLIVISLRGKTTKNKPVMHHQSNSGRNL
ncbi:MFS transporter [Sporolactobacillus terrae]|uniref:MFS transporter n=1 Tax=Sporolactobacillus terrae TaxID=269673 RepID=A0ABX5Q4Q0_9BACL|nr:MFS transporter [Sporolactobacillus terrae]QAA21604.1 MFS transporter [Sporolactobacillus terrae]QAA24576.1 MFS transporter [Sporolactobacillus terrae]UAK16414.1 MFS transporter [Sporolactobacillus terrae]